MFNRILRLELRNSATTNPAHLRRYVKAFLMLNGNHRPLTLATGALAAVNYGQDHGLALTTIAPQAEEADGVFWVQAVAATVTDRLEVRLLSEKSGTEEI